MVIPISRGDRHRARLRASRSRAIYELIEDHIHLVPPLARRIAWVLPPSFDVEDLEGSGYVGLVNAASRYRPAQHGGAPFAAFARPAIRGAILSSVRRRNWTEGTMEPLEAASHLGRVDNVIETEIDQGRLRRRVAEACAELKPRDRAVIEAYYSDEEPTFEAVGAQLGVSRPRASQLHARAIEALQSLLPANLSPVTL